jgi:hypothetical protein
MLRRRAGSAASRVYVSRRVRALAPRASLAMGDAPPPGGGLHDGGADGALRIVCTPLEERIFATLLAAVRHFGAACVRGALLPAPPPCPRARTHARSRTAH